MRALTNMISAIMCAPNVANFTATENAKPVRMAPCILMPQQNCGRDPGRDFDTTKVIENGEPCLPDVTRQLSDSAAQPSEVLILQIEKVIIIN